MGDCTAFMEGDVVKDVCKRCDAKYIVRDNKGSLWNPSTELPIGGSSYQDVPLCKVCKSDLIALIVEFIK